MSTFDEDLFQKGLELIIQKLKVVCSKSLLKISARSFD